MDVGDNYNEFPSFFKIILQPRNDLLHLGIPKKFMTDHASDLTNVLSLVVPTGKTWKVKLHRENGRAWLTEGWPEFVKYYSICHGHILMFTYAKTSSVKVCIFDNTPSEIEYPLDPQETMETKTKINSSSPSSSALAPLEMGMAALVRAYRRNSRILTHDDIVTINSHEFQNPSFIVIMQPSYILKFSLYVPVVFASKYLGSTEGNFTLEIPSGDTWPVRCIGNTTKYKRFSVGWKEFALDNKLRVGDLCVFELAKDSKWWFKVEIIHRSSNVDVDLSSSTICPNVEADFILIDD